MDIFYLENGHDTTADDAEDFEAEQFEEDAIENGGNIENGVTINGKVSEKQPNGVVVSETEDEEEEREGNSKHEQESSHKNGAESAKLKMKKQKLDRRTELASYQNLVGYFHFVIINVE